MEIKQYRDRNECRLSVLGSCAKELALQREPDAEAADGHDVDVSHRTAARSRHRLPRRLDLASGELHTRRRWRFCRENVLYW